MSQELMQKTADAVIEDTRNGIKSVGKELYYLAPNNANVITEDDYAPSYITD